jgi:RHS repeat-associated protein
VTKLQLWSAASAQAAQINFRRQYDIFGNQLKAEVSCCSLKRFTFSADTAGMYFSLPMSATDGPTAGPNLSASFAYDFNTSFLNSQTDANSLVTSYTPPDAALRVRTITQPSGATLETFFADPSYPGKDGLVYQSKLTYQDGATQRIQVTNQWLDGAGQVVRTGSAAGATPTGFDAVKSIYDDLGRPRKTTNPYVGDSNGNTAGLPNATVYDYDDLSRVKTVTLPDGNTVTTNYNGVVVTVTDQVRRKRQSQVDGLGRLITVTEQDPATGTLSLATNYTYDMLNNLTSVDQGGQTRSYSYDSLSRMINGTTPEGGAVSLAYVDFGAVKKRTDARNVETHYKYDSLNRPTQVWYTGLGGDDAGTVRPPLPTGVVATSDVIIAYNTTTPGNGAVSRVNDAAGFETYGYDSLARTTSKTRTIDGVNSYQTQYQYNQAGQLALMIYPSGKRVRMNHDSRGRLSGEDKVDTAGTVLTSYVSNIGYNVTGQVTGMTSGSGVNESYFYSNDRLQLTRQTATKSAATLMDLSYSYAASAGASGAGTVAGNSGQLMRITGTVNSEARGEAYNYDDLGRLASASGFYAQRNYSYDRWGNRTGVSGGSTQSITLQQQSAGVPNNRIATVNGVGYLYDASGNLTSDGAHSYQYDGEGRIATVDNGIGASYFYDSGNRRVKKQQGTTTTYYIWQGAQVIAEYSNAAAGAGGVSYYLADTLSTRMTTDSNGVMKGTQDHLPFGEDSGTSTGQVEKHRFTSYERDNETSTDYAINRQYAQSSGRFNRPDPVGGSATSPQSLNRYAYSSNDPINSIDPSGLAGETVWGLYRGTFLGASGFSPGAGMMPDGDTWGYRLGSLPGFGTMWGSLSQLEEWRHNVLVATKGQYDPAFPKQTDDFDYDNLAGVSFQDPSGRPPQKESACPPDKQRFFKWLVGPLTKVAQDLNTTLPLMLTQAAKEGGWNKEGLDHNIPLNNPFGVNIIMGGRAVGNVHYPTLDAAIQYWKQTYGDRVGGTRTLEAFAYGMQHPTHGQPYNASKAYEGNYKDRYSDVLKWMKRCGIQ